MFRILKSTFFFHFSLLVVVCVLFSYNAKAQDCLKIKGGEQELNTRLQSLYDSLQTSDAQLLKIEMGELLRQEGYYLAEILRAESDSACLIVKPGKQFFQGNFGFQMPEQILIPAKKTAFAPLNPNAQAGYYLQYLENNGYPFANLQLVNYHINNDTLHGSWEIEPGPLRTWDSLVIKGFDRFSENTLVYELGFKKGTRYSEKYLSSLEQRIAQVEFLQSERPPAVAFTESKTILYLYLAERKSNQIDGVIGLNTTSDGEVTLNGDINLRLLHAFKKGEEIQLNWRSPDQSVQSLNVLVDVPFLFKTPIGWRNQLQIFKQDSSFINSNVQSKLKYLLYNQSYLTGGVQFQSSNNLTEENTSLQSYNSIFYQIGLQLQQTNRALLPYKGFRVLAEVGTGERENTENSLQQYNFSLLAQKFINPWPRHVFALQINSEALFSDNYFTNELYRIGGLQTLRGFNEQSIFSNAYGVATAEYRLLIGEYDFISLFTDVAYSENKVDEFSSNWFTGIGTGINFQTGGGIFSLSLALGKSNESNFDFRTVKVHFGYVNRF